MEGKSGRSSLLFESGPPENWGALATTSEETLGTHMDSLDVISAPLLAHHDLSVRQLTPRNGIASGGRGLGRILDGRDGLARGHR